MITADKTQLRNFLAAKQGFSDERFCGKKGAIEYIKQAGSVQYDPIDVCGKNAELVFQSRVKNFSKQMLYELIYEDRAAIEGFDKCICIYPSEDFDFFAPVRDYMTSRLPQSEQIERVKAEILSEIEVKGPLCSKDFAKTEKVYWWWSDTDVSRAALETLYYEGKLLIHHRKDTLKYYSLTEKLLPQPNRAMRAPFNKIDYLAARLKRRINAAGMLADKPSDAFIGMDGFTKDLRSQAFAILLERGDIFPVQLKGEQKVYYLDSRDKELLLNANRECGVKFIAPLDGFMWDRRLIEDLYGFKYRWEIYTPLAKREYGYYVLPVLYKNGFIGRIEAVADKKAKALTIKNFWYENDRGGYSHQIKEAAENFAKFNGCDSVKLLCDF